jgi:hypothetical protein
VCGIGLRHNDVQSGVGFVHNTLLIDDVQKAVLRLPWDAVGGATPYWYATHRNQAAFARRVLDYYHGRPRWWKLLRILWAALRG